jgi:hypothetical protein
LFADLSASNLPIIEILQVGMELMRPFKMRVHVHLESGFDKLSRRDVLESSGSSALISFEMKSVLA